MNIADLERRVDALRGAPVPTFEEFRKQWEDMDELSKSLTQFGCACAEENGRYWGAVRCYLPRMGIEVEPMVSLKKLGEELTSDE